MSQVDPSVLREMRRDGAGGRISRTLLSLENFSKRDPAQGEEILRAYVDGAWSHRGPSEKELTSLYELALRYDRKNAGLHYSWGWDLTMLGARTEIVEHRNRLMREANERYARALKHDPRMDSAWNNWGNNLVVLSRTTAEPEKSALLKQAFAHYAEAVRLKPTKQETFFNWGKTLFQLGEHAAGGERQGLLGEAIEKLDDCLRIKPNRDEALLLKSKAYLFLALDRPHEERDRLLKEALESIGKAEQVAPRDALIHQQWGRCLVAAAELGDDPAPYLRYALDEFEAASNLWPEDSAILEDYCATEEALRLLAPTRKAHQ